MNQTPPTSPMYKRLRLRLMLWYVLLSGATSVALIALGTWLCYARINESLNDKLEDLIASNLTQIKLVDGKPQFLAAREPVHSQWAHEHSTVQLYDPQGKLVDKFGPAGIEKLDTDYDYFEDTIGNRKVRGTSDPIYIEGKLVGHIQAEVPVAVRDKATLEFALIMASFTPVLLLALALSGYFLSLKASKPAEEAFDLLKQFMADASHELRTPVHAIQLVAENVQAEQDEHTQVSKDMEVIVRSTDRMSRLIDDMLLLTKMELQQVTLKTAPVQIDQLVRHAYEELKHTFADKNIALELGTVESAVVEGDSDALFRVLANLLQNALRYTDAGGQVTISSRKAGSHVQIAVADTGIGIDAESLAHIFDRFYRIDKSRTREAGGSGLGLSIVRAICEQHHGSIGVQSQEGAGTTFTVTLPRKWMPGSTASFSVGQSNDGTSKS